VVIGVKAENENADRRARLGENNEAPNGLRGVSRSGLRTVGLDALRPLERLEPISKLCEGADS
jgi:hypothetical protein